MLYLKLFYIQYDERVSTHCYAQGYIIVPELFLCENCSFPIALWRVCCGKSALCDGQSPSSLLGRALALRTQHCPDYRAFCEAGPTSCGTFPSFFFLLPKTSFTQKFESPSLLCDLLLIRLYLEILFNFQCFWKFS